MDSEANKPVDVPTPNRQDIVASYERTGRRDDIVWEVLHRRWNEAADRVVASRRSSDFPDEAFDEFLREFADRDEPQRAADVFHRETFEHAMGLPTARAFRLSDVQRDRDVITKAGAFVRPIFTTRNESGRPLSPELLTDWRNGDSPRILRIDQGAFLDANNAKKCSVSTVYIPTTINGQFRLSQSKAGVVTVAPPWTKLDAGEANSRTFLMQMPLAVLNFGHKFKLLGRDPRPTHPDDLLVVTQMQRRLLTVEESFELVDNQLRDLSIAPAGHVDKADEKNNVSRSEAGRHSRMNRDEEISVDIRFFSTGRDATFGAHVLRDLVSLAATDGSTLLPGELSDLKKQVLDFVDETAELPYGIASNFEDRMREVTRRDSR